MNRQKRYEERFKAVATYDSLESCTEHIRRTIGDLYDILKVLESLPDFGGSVFADEGGIIMDVGNEEEWFALRKKMGKKLIPRSSRTNRIFSATQEHDYWYTWGKVDEEWDRNYSIPGVVELTISEAKQCTRVKTGVKEVDVYEWVCEGEEEGE